MTNQTRTVVLLIAILLCGLAAYSLLSDQGKGESVRLRDSGPQVSHIESLALKGSEPIGIGEGNRDLEGLTEQFAVEIPPSVSLRSESVPRTSGPGGIDVELFDAEGIRVLDFMVNAFTNADPRLLSTPPDFSNRLIGHPGSYYSPHGIRSNAMGYARVPHWNTERISIVAWSLEIPAVEMTGIRCPRPGERTATLTLRVPPSRLLTTVHGYVKRKDGTLVEGSVVKSTIIDSTIPGVTRSWLNTASRRAVTNAKGEFLIRGIEPGVQFELSVDIGYCNVAKVAMDPLDHQEIRRVDFLVPTTRSVTAMITFEGRPVSGVQIGNAVVYDVEGESRSTYSGAISGPDGQAVIVVPESFRSLSLSPFLSWITYRNRPGSRLYGDAPFHAPKTEFWSYLSRLRADPVEYSREDCDQPISLELRDYFQSAIAHSSGQEPWLRLRAFVDSGQWDAKDFDPIALDAIQRNDPLRLCCHLFSMRQAFGFVPATPDR